MKIVESTGDGCSYPHSVAPIHFTVRVYGSVKVERWGRKEKRREGKRREGKSREEKEREEKKRGEKGREDKKEKERGGKRREEKGLLCALVEG